MKCTNCGAELTGKFCTVCGTPANAQPKTETVAQDIPQNVEPMQYNPAPEQTPQAEPMQYNPAPEQTPQAEPMQYNPAPEQAPQAEPMQYNPTPEHAPQAEPMQYNPVQYGQQQPQKQYTQTTQPRNFSQQYQQYGGMNTANHGGYTGQQFTNQSNNPTVNPQGKKSMSTGKIVGLVLGIVGGVILLLCIIFGVAACSFFNSVGNAFDKTSDAYSDIFDSIGNQLDGLEDDYNDNGFELDDFMSYDNAENTITFGGEYTFVE